MNRITNKMIESKLEYLNKLTNSPLTPYKRVDGSMVAQVGNYHLSGAYGGVMVQRMSNTSGGVTTPITYGHVPKRECFDTLCAYINGIEAGKEL